MQARPGNKGPRVHWLALILAAGLAAVGCHTTSLDRTVEGVEPDPARLGAIGPPTLEPVITPEPSPEEAPRPTPRSTHPPRSADGRPLAGTTIVVDPGHGGRDPGALGSGASAMAEKHLVLAIANAVSERLRAWGATVIQTRTNDTFVELEERAAMADRFRADLFVSIHADAIANPGISGATVYVSRSASARSVHAASSLQAALNAAGIDCRGLRRADYRVLVRHSRPAVLVECGYLTNTGDARLLNTAAYRERIAEAIAQGIGEYFRAYP